MSVDKKPQNSIYHPKLLLGLKILLAAIFVYFAIYLYSFKVEPTAADKAWNQTKATNTIQAYQEFLDTFPESRHKDTATTGIIEIKQDALNFEQAQNAGTYEAFKHYLANCRYKNCPNSKAAKATIKKAEQIKANFKFHLKVKNLSIGKKGFALNDIKQFAKLFPNDQQIEKWRKIVGEEFLSLAHKAINQNRLQKAEVYQTKAADILGEDNIKPATALLAKLQESKENSINSKHDPNINENKDIETALAEGDIENIQSYLKTCTTCTHKVLANTKLASYEKLASEFNQNLKNDRLTKGNKNAAKNLQELKELFPESEEAVKWSQKIADRFASLAKKTDDAEKAKIYKKSALKYATEEQMLKTENIKKVATKKEKPQSENILLSLENGDIDAIKEYIKTCTTCTYKDSANVKLASYEKLAGEFNQNLKNDRLTKGNKNAAKNLQELKEHFPESEEAAIWSQQIADKFYQLALAATKSRKALDYVSQGLAFAVDKAKLNELKTEKTKNYSRDELYEQLQASPSIYLAQEYIKACKGGGCEQLIKVKKDLARAEEIKKDFIRHIKSTALTKGSSGNALEDIVRLEKLFPKEPLVKTWNNEIIAEFIKLIDKAFKSKKYSKARQYLASALEIQENHSQLRDRLQKLNSIQPEYSIYTKATKLVPAMVYLSGRKFAMGGKFNRSKPARKVGIRPFRISRYEVTFAKYQQFAKETGTKINHNGWGADNRPVINVSWHDAVNYTKWLSKKTGRKFRLPSEAEWEYAASKAPVLLRNSKFNTSKLCRYANGADAGSNFPWKNRKCNDGFKSLTAPVGTYKPNSYGLYDMYGNVWEWTYDCWHYNFKGAPRTSKPWVSRGDCRYRVIKGGGWNSSADFMRPKYRTNAKANVRYNYIGFRIVEEL